MHAQATRVLVGLFVSAAFLYLVVRNVSPGEIFSYLAQTHWRWLALSAGFNLAMLWARGFRWRPLFYPASQPGWPLVSATAIGLMANNVLPLRMGDLVRGHLAARGAGLSFWTTMATLAVERVLDMLSVLLILGAVVFIVPVPLWLQAGGLILLALDLLAIGILLLLARERRSLASCLMRIPRLGQTLNGWLVRFSVGLGSLRPGPHLWPLLGWTILIWILNAVAVWAALRSVGLALPLSASLTVLAFIGIGVSLPSAPGYLGTLQFFIVQALAIYAVTGAEAVSLSLLLHAASYIPLTLAGWVLLTSQGISLWKVSREASGQNL